MRLNRKGHVETFVVLWLTGFVGCLLLGPLNHLLRDRHYSKGQIVFYELLMVAILLIVFNFIIWFPWGALKKTTEVAEPPDGQDQESESEE